MKNNKLTFLKIAIVAVLGLATTLGCEKSQTELEIAQLEQKSKSSSDTTNISILTLRQYFADRLNVSLEQISYSEERKQFIFRGVDQISRKNLRDSYINNYLKFVNQ